MEGRGLHCTRPHGSEEQTRWRAERASGPRSTGRSCLGTWCPACFPQRCDAMYPAAFFAQPFGLPHLVWGGRRNGSCRSGAHRTPDTRRLGPPPCRRPPLQVGDGNLRGAVEFCQGNLLRHSFLDTNPRTVAELYTECVEAGGITGQQGVGKAGVRGAGPHQRARVPPPSVVCTAAIWHGVGACKPVCSHRSVVLGARCACLWGMLAARHATDLILKLLLLPPTAPPKRPLAAALRTGSMSAPSSARARASAACTTSWLRSPARGRSAPPGCTTFRRAWATTWLRCSWRWLASRRRRRWLGWPATPTARLRWRRPAAGGRR